MKYSNFLPIFLLSFFIASCGSSSSSNQETSKVETQKIQLLDSISAEMEKAASEIEADSKALDDALSELDEIFNQ